MPQANENPLLDRPPSETEVVVSCLRLVADTVEAEIVSEGGRMWTELEVISDRRVRSGRGVLPAPMGTRLTSAKQLNRSPELNRYRDADCVQAGCDAIIHHNFVGRQYHRLQHGRNPEHARIFIATFLDIGNGHIVCSIPRRSRQIASWLQELHSYESTRRRDQP